MRGSGALESSLEKAGENNKMFAATLCKVSLWAQGWNPHLRPLATDAEVAEGWERHGGKDKGEEYDILSLWFHVKVGSRTHGIGVS